MTTHKIHWVHSGPFSSEDVYEEDYEEPFYWLVVKAETEEAGVFDMEIYFDTFDDAYMMMKMVNNRMETVELDFNDG